MQLLVQELGAIPKEVVQNVKKVEEVLDDHVCSDERQVGVVELHGEGPLEWDVLEQVPRIEYW